MPEASLLLVKDLGIVWWLLTIAFLPPLVLSRLRSMLELLSRDYFRIGISSSLIEKVSI